MYCNDENDYVLLKVRNLGSWNGTNKNGLDIDKNQ